MIIRTLSKSSTRFNRKVECEVFSLSNFLEDHCRQPLIPSLDVRPGLSKK